MDIIPHLLPFLDRGPDLFSFFVLIREKDVQWRKHVRRLHLRKSQVPASRIFQAFPNLHTLSGAPLLITSVEELLLFDARIGGPRIHLQLREEGVTGVLVYEALRLACERAEGYEEHLDLLLGYLDGEPMERAGREGRRVSFLDTLRERKGRPLSPRGGAKVLRIPSRPRTQRGIRYFQGSLSLEIPSILYTIPLFASTLDFLIQILPIDDLTLNLVSVSIVENGEYRETTEPRWYVRISDVTRTKEGWEPLFPHLPYRLSLEPRDLPHGLGVFFREKIVRRLASKNTLSLANEILTLQSQLPFLSTLVLLDPDAPLEGEEMVQEPNSRAWKHLQTSSSIRVFQVPISASHLPRVQKLLPKVREVWIVGRGDSPRNHDLLIHRL